MSVSIQRSILIVLLSFIFSFSWSSCWCCFLLINDHLAHCSLASSAKISSQKLSSFQNSPYFKFSVAYDIIGYSYFLLFYFPACAFSFVHLVSSVVLYWPLYSAIFYLYSSPYFLHFTWFIFFLPTGVYQLLCFNETEIHTCSPNIFGVTDSHLAIDLSSPLAWDAKCP